MEGPAFRDVPCGTCTLCCRGQAVVIMPEHGDDPQRYTTVRDRHPLTGKPALFIPQVDGACFYLQDNKCAIYDTRPSMCRTYDCGDDYAKTPRPERRRRVKAGIYDKALYERGREIQELRHREGAK